MKGFNRSNHISLSCRYSGYIKEKGWQKGNIAMYLAWQKDVILLWVSTLLSLFTRSATIRRSPPATPTRRTSLFGKVRLLIRQLLAPLCVRGGDRNHHHFFFLPLDMQCVLLYKSYLLPFDARLHPSTDQRWKNKFWGKSLEILPTGMVNVTLPR